MKKNVITLFCSSSAINKAKSVSHVQHKSSRALLGPVLTENECYDVANDTALVKLIGFLKSQESHSKNGLQPQLMRYDASIDADGPNQSMTLSLDGPLVNQMVD